MDEDNGEQGRPGDSRRPNGQHIRTPTTRGDILWPSDAEPLPPAWRIEAFEADDGTVPFERFAEGDRRSPAVVGPVQAAPASDEGSLMG